MAVIDLKMDGPIVRRALALPDSGPMTEVGLIPKNMCDCGCKIYASMRNEHLTIIGIHSRAYGCSKDPMTDSVDISPMYRWKDGMKVFR